MFRRTLLYGLLQHNNENELRKNFRRKKAASKQFFFSFFANIQLKIELFLLFSIQGPLKLFTAPQYFVFNSTFPALLDFAGRGKDVNTRSLLVIPPYFFPFNPTVLRKQLHRATKANIYSTTQMLCTYHA